MLKACSNLQKRPYDIKSAEEIYLQTYPLYEALKEAEIIQIGAEYEYAPNFSRSTSRD